MVDHCSFPSHITAYPLGVTAVKYHSCQYAVVISANTNHLFICTVCYGRVVGYIRGLCNGDVGVCSQLYSAM